MIVHTKEDLKYAKRIGRRIKDRMERFDITFLELEERSGVTASQICKITKGTKVPLITTLRKIALALNMDLYELIK